jgi:hypothetical protein
MSLKVRKRTWGPNPSGSLPPTMRMRQSLAQFEEAFREEAADSIVRRERLRKESAQRARFRRVARSRKAGTFRFLLLALTLIATAVIVTIVMFETLAMLAG